MTNLRDLMVPGEPLLVTNTSHIASEMMVKEIAWAAGVEVRSMDMEFLSPADVDSDWSSFKSGDWVLITSASSADQETQEAVLRRAHDPDKIVIVADKKVPSHMKPESFKHWAKF